MVSKLLKLAGISAAVIGGVAIGSSIASADVILNPTAATYVNENSVSSTNSTSTILNVKNNEPYDRVAFVQFSGADIGGANHVTGASLGLTMSLSVAVTGGINAELFGIVTTQTAPNLSTLDWTAAAANDGGIYVDYTQTDDLTNSSAVYYDDVSEVPLASINVDSTTSSSYNISSTMIDSFLNANTNSTITFVITTNTVTTSAILDIDSGYNSGHYNGTGAPTLTFTSEAVPAPASLGLVGIGALGLLLLKRRRAVCGFDYSHGSDTIMGAPSR